ncbi:hypothetical protein [Longimicrobium sp.]|uniref:hypothetical protein n=1 Tax=Longimicrobium sp. TaxID=2029185 RepID=UPI002D7EEF56|nr:hypothetical protein [Longimicrobium sp.]
MRFRLATPATLLAFATAACDPGFTMTLRQPLGPAPEAACVARTLSTSRFVSQSWTGAENGFGVTLRDGAGRTWSATLELLRPRRDSAHVASVRYNYLLYSRPGADEEPGMVAAAAGLLGELRAACAPASAPAVECATQGAPVAACAAVGRAPLGEERSRP